MSSQPKVVLITGATGGIGKATSIALAQEGYTLALHYNSASQQAVDELLSSIASAHKTTNPSSARALAFQADLSDPDAVRDLHERVVSTLGAPAILFLNAGTTAGVSGVASIADVPLAAFEAAWRVNAAAPFLLAQLCLPAMEAAGWGRVVFNSSVAAITGGVVGGHYASSKAALHGLVRWLAGTVAAKGITVNAVAPALVEDTTMLPEGGEELAKSELVLLCPSLFTVVREQRGWGLGSSRFSCSFADLYLGTEIPVGRFGRPEEIASTVLWMINNAYVTNKIIAVDGGMSY
ncbi:hypothetical protein MBLNU459_g7539t1 [Dothideomycetes sp. NU459]